MTIQASSISHKQCITIILNFQISIIYGSLNPTYFKLDSLIICNHNKDFGHTGKTDVEKFIFQFNL